MASARLSQGALMLLKQFVNTWENGSSCLILGIRIRGSMSNHKTHQRAAILHRAGYVEPWGGHKKSYRVTPSGIARHDAERLSELVGRVE